MPADRFTLEVLPDTLAVCRLEAGDPVPPWVPTAPFLSVTRTRSELSVVCEATAVPEGVRAERAWRCLEVHGPFDFAVTGVIAVLSGALAAARVSVLPIATFDTDYLLVPSSQLERAVEALSSAGHEVRRAKPATDPGIGASGGAGPLAPDPSTRESE
jgi:hypothetical protein